MTEREWLGGMDPMPMLEYWRYRGRDRKLRLVGCAACRRVWDLMHDERCRRAIEAAEGFADETTSYAVLDRLSGEAEEAFEDALTEHYEGETAAAAVAEAASYASSPYLDVSVMSVVLRGAVDASPHGQATEQAAQAELVRDIFGNPFRPVAVDPRWLTSDVVTLARTIYDDRAFDRLPILADALQDAGCDNDDVLAHCRDPQLTHVRGCWVVDLMLGKA